MKCAKCNKAVGITVLLRVAIMSPERDWVNETTPNR